jgi:Fe-S cluster biogenesis protein NfuA
MPVTEAQVPTGMNTGVSITPRRVRMRVCRAREAASVEQRIRDTLDALRPLLHIATARIELVEYQVESGVAVVRLDGDCPDCDLTAAMLRQGIEARLRMRVPEVREVRAL